MPVFRYFRMISFLRLYKYSFPEITEASKRSEFWIIFYGGLNSFFDICIFIIYLVNDGKDGTQTGQNCGLFLWGVKIVCLRRIDLFFKFIGVCRGAFELIIICEERTNIFQKQFKGICVPNKCLWTW